jgi:hypothetical protein
MCSEPGLIDLADRQCCDTYAGVDQEQGQDDVHGPYWLREISPETFASSSPAAAEGTIQAWADSFESEPPSTRSRLRAAVYPGCTDRSTGYWTYVTGRNTTGDGSSVTTDSTSSWSLIVSQRPSR